MRETVSLDLTDEQQEILTKMMADIEFRDNEYIGGPVRGMKDLVQRIFATGLREWDEKNRKDLLVEEGYLA